MGNCDYNPTSRSYFYPIYQLVGTRLAGLFFTTFYAYLHYLAMIVAMCRAEKQEYQVGSVGSWIAKRVVFEFLADFFPHFFVVHG